MTALATSRLTRYKSNPADRVRVFDVAADETIYPGALVAILDGEAYAATADGGGVIAGWADTETTQKEGATSATVNALGTGKVTVREGEAWFANGETVAVADIGSADGNAYVVDDQTVGTTRGLAPRVGPVLSVSSADGVLVGINYRINADFESRPRMQSGTVTLASGTATVDAGVALKTTSRIHLTWEDAAADIVHANTGGSLAVTARTAGVPGTAEFTVSTVNGAGAVDTTGAGVVAYTITDDSNI